jgi:hypothetical protein
MVVADKCVASGIVPFAVSGGADAVPTDWLENILIRNVSAQDSQRPVDSP